MNAILYIVRSFLGLPVVKPVLWLCSGGTIALFISALSVPARDVDGTLPAPVPAVRSAESSPGSEPSATTKKEAPELQSPSVTARERPKMSVVSFLPGLLVLAMFVCYEIWLWLERQTQKYIELRVGWERQKIADERLKVKRWRDSEQAWLLAEEARIAERVRDLAELEIERRAGDALRATRQARLDAEAARDAVRHALAMVRKREQRLVGLEAREVAVAAREQKLVTGEKSLSTEREHVSILARANEALVARIDAGCAYIAEGLLDFLLRDRLATRRLMSDPFVRELLVEANCAG